MIFFSWLGTRFLFVYRQNALKLFVEFQVLTVNFPIFSHPGTQDWSGSQDCFVLLYIILIFKIRGVNDILFEVKNALGLLFTYLVL